MEVKNTEGFGRITVPSMGFPDLGSLFSNFVKKWRFFKNYSKLKILSKLKTFQNLVFEDFQILVTIDDFSNYGKTKEFDFLNILVRNDVFSNFGKKWRFFKNQPKLKIFHNFVVIDDFSNFGKIWRFFKIWYNQRDVIFCKNRWFLKFW